MVVNSIESSASASEDRIQTPWSGVWDTAAAAPAATPPVADTTAAHSIDPIEQVTAAENGSRTLSRGAPLPVSARIGRVRATRRSHIADGVGGSTHTELVPTALYPGLGEADPPPFPVAPLANLDRYRGRGRRTRFDAPVAPLVDAQPERTTSVVGLVLDVTARKARRTGNTYWVLVVADDTCRKGVSIAVFNGRLRGPDAYRRSVVGLPPLICRRDAQSRLLSSFFIDSIRLPSRLAGGAGLLWQRAVEP